MKNLEIWMRYFPKSYVVSELLRTNSDKLFLFGDNNQRVGTAGQAVIRNEANAMGISTKLLPKNTADAFMTDSDFASNKATINNDIYKAKERAIKEGKTIVLPKGGFGTGLAKLATKAPQTFAYLNKRLQEEFSFNNTTGELSVLDITQPSTNVETTEEFGDIDAMLANAPAAAFNPAIGAMFKARTDYPVLSEFFMELTDEQKDKIKQDLNITSLVNFVDQYKDYVKTNGGDQNSFVEQIKKCYL